MFRLVLAKLDLRHSVIYFCLSKNSFDLYLLSLIDPGTVFEYPTRIANFEYFYMVSF